MKGAEIMIIIEMLVRMNNSGDQDRDCRDRDRGRLYYLYSTPLKLREKIKVFNLQQPLQGY